MGNHGVGEGDWIAIHGAEGGIDLVLAVGIDEGAYSIDGLMKVGIRRDCYQADDLVGAIIHDPFRPPVAC
jgi:hypothetical protein